MQNANDMINNQDFIPSSCEFTIRYSIYIELYLTTADSLNFSGFISCTKHCQGDIHVKKMKDEKNDPRFRNHYLFCPLNSVLCVTSDIQHYGTYMVNIDYTYYIYIYILYYLYIYT